MDLNKSRIRCNRPSGRYLPEIIKDGIGKYKAVRYEKITPILIECIKDLYTKVEKLEEEVRILKM